MTELSAGSRVGEPDKFPAMLRRSGAGHGSIDMMGDRAATVVVAGIAAGLETILVLTTSIWSEACSRLARPIFPTPPPAADAVESA